MRIEQESAARASRTWVTAAPLDVRFVTEASESEVTLGTWNGVNALVVIAETSTVVVPSMGTKTAEGPATAGLDELVGEAALDREVREQAIFALSQRPRDEGIPALVKVVRTSKDPALRKKALFWLGQSGDPRALQLIEELLAKG